MVQCQIDSKTSFPWFTNVVEITINAQTNGQNTYGVPCRHRVEATAEQREQTFRGKGTCPVQVVFVSIPKAQQSTASSLFGTGTRMTVVCIATYLLHKFTGILYVFKCTVPDTRAAWFCVQLFQLPTSNVVVVVVPALRYVVMFINHRHHRRSGLRLRLFPKPSRCHH